MSVLFGMPVDLAYHLVCWFAAILAPLPGGLAAVAAIVAFTMLVRLALLPLSYYAVRGERARGRLLPQVQELQRRHARDPERLRRELSALQRAEGASLYAGCLPLLLQLPFFSVMYRLFLSHSVAGSPNALLSHRLLAAPLGSWWLGGAGPFSAQGAVFAGLFLLLAAVGVAAIRAARRARAATVAGLADGGHGHRRGGPANGGHGHQDGATDGGGGPGRRLAQLGHAVRIAGDGGHRAAGRGPVPAHHGDLDTGRAGGD